MSERDVAIGRTIAALRGGQSQQALADAMRLRGHRWSQATVWSVERGSRALRFSEAEDLREILSLTDLSELSMSWVDARVRHIRWQFIDSYRVALDRYGTVLSLADELTHALELDTEGQISEAERLHCEVDLELIAGDKFLREARARLEQLKAANRGEDG
jgi:hypothetical protein